MKKKTAEIALSLALLAAMLYLIIKSQEIGNAVSAAIDRCVTVIIPSLLAFMVLSDIIMKTGAHRLLFKPLYLLLKPLIHLDERAFSVLLLSMVGGYPVGAKLIKGLYSSGTYSLAYCRKLLPCCFCSGPAFLSGIVGVTLYGSVSAGIAVYAANLLAGLFTAALVFRKDKPARCSGKTEIGFNFGMLSDSGKTCFGALYTVCTMIILFSILSCLLLNEQAIKLLELLPFDSSAVSSTLNSLLEISTICSFPVRGNISFALIAALTSFGGICVIMQIGAIGGECFDFKRFMAVRLLGAALSFAFALPLSFTAVSAVTASTTVAFTAAAIPAAPACLFICALLLLGLIMNREKNFCER